METNTYQLFTATGCARCRIVKTFMQQKGTDFQELDIKAAGSEAFKAFYKENRKQVSRGEHGIEFPVLFTGEAVRQGIGPILGRIAAGSRLEPCIALGEYEPGKVSGLNIHATDLDADTSARDAYLEVLGFIKEKGLASELEADGRNPKFLETLIQENLIIKLDFILRGPAGLYAAIAGYPLDESDLVSSLGLLNKCREKQIKYRLILPVSTFSGADGMGQFLSPEQAAQAAQLAAEATGTQTHPFFIQAENPNPGHKLESLPGPALFKYRTRCRRYMVKAEILK